MKFENLSMAIDRRGIKKTAIAKAIGVTERALRYKMEGRSPFSWEQVCVIQERFFPDADIKSLMAHGDLCTASDSAQDAS